MRKDPDPWQAFVRRIQALMRTNVTSDRAEAFAIFLWQRFRDDRCPQSAGALAFTTLISLVPLTAAILGVLSAFPVFERWQADLTNFVFDNFVPAAGRTVQAYLTEFANNASQMLNNSVDKSRAGHVKHHLRNARPSPFLSGSLFPHRRHAPALGRRALQA